MRNGGGPERKMTRPAAHNPPIQHP
jgi:hypothetical protein